MSCCDQAHARPIAPCSPYWVRATCSFGFMAACLGCGRISQNPARKTQYAASRPKPVDATPAQISAAKFMKSAIP